MLPQSAIAAPGAADPARDGEWEDWMAASLAGDRRAYDCLLRAMLPMLRDIARRRIADGDEAEDAVQDTLLTIHVLRHTCQPERPIRPWIAAICERRCAERKARLRHRRPLAMARHAEAGAIDGPRTGAWTPRGPSRAAATLPARLAATFAWRLQWRRRAS